MSMYHPLDKSKEEMKSKIKSHSGVNVTEYEVITQDAASTKRSQMLRK
jgi:hypothetical protein